MLPTHQLNLLWRSELCALFPSRFSAMSVELQLVGVERGDLQKVHLQNFPHSQTGTPFVLYTSRGHMGLWTGGEVGPQADLGVSVGVYCLFARGRRYLKVFHSFSKHPLTASANEAPTLQR